MIQVYFFLVKDLRHNEKNQLQSATELGEAGKKTDQIREKRDARRIAQSEFIDTYKHRQCWHLFGQICYLYCKTTLNNVSLTYLPKQFD